MAEITCDNLDQVITKLHFPYTKVALPKSREVTEADLKLAHTWWRDLDQSFLEDPESAIETGPLFEAAKLKNKGALDYADVKALQKAARTVIKLDLAAGLATCIMKEGPEVAKAVLTKATTPEELDILRIQSFEVERGFVTPEEAAAEKAAPTTKEEASTRISAAAAKRAAKTALKPAKKGAK